MEANGIVLSPDPRLRQECAVIEEITPAIEALAEKMKKMMFENGGCGLAAPQIGELIQLVTIDCDYSDKNDYDPYVLINPVIVEQSDHLVPFSEGCLSIPGISCEIERPDHVVVEAYDLDANLIRYEATGDLFCVCLQHEIDHLHGNTMFERLKPMQRIKAVKEYQDALARGARPGETGRSHRPGAERPHIIPCSNILALLRNCARDDMWALSTGDCVVLARFARVPLGQGGASSLIGALLEELLLLRLFLWFWVYLFLLKCYCGWTGDLAFRWSL